MAVLSFLFLMCVALSSLTAGFRLPERPVNPNMPEIYPDFPFIQLPCWRGWREFNDRCYKLFRTPKTWHQALADCKMRHSDLTSVRNSDDLLMVQSVMGLPLGQAGVWVGGTDAVTEGQWQWSDGEAFSWTLWSPGQPDNLDEADCMSVGIGGLEYDENCKKKLPYVCSTTLMEI